MKSKIYLIVLLISLTLYSCGNQSTEKQNNTKNDTAENILSEKIVGIGRVIPQGGISQLAATASGIIKDIKIDKGEEVKEGATLIILDNIKESLKIKEINNQISAQKNMVASANLSLKQEKDNLAEKERLLKDGSDLLQIGARSQEDVRTLQNDYDLALEKTQKAENELAIQEAKLNEIISIKETKVNDLNNTIIKAPMNGTILDIDVKKGEAINLYQTYGRMAPKAPLIVMAEIDELFSDKIHIGQQCDIYLIEQTTPIASGEITYISLDLKKKSLFSDDGYDMEDRRIREIEILLKDIQKPLLIDTKVECIIKTK